MVQKTIKKVGADPSFEKLFEEATGLHHAGRIEEAIIAYSGFFCAPRIPLRRS